MDKQGNTFTIDDGEVWQLDYNNDNVWGKAALFGLFCAVKGRNLKLCNLMCIVFFMKNIWDEDKTLVAKI
ncbi:hypothetical protein LHK94_17860 [Dickeya zeae]|uniref:Uncharacterized protein n=1 Tax=Dickeya zeae (strain Ech586) TaxID=590409 RepID=D2BXS5_DICZ5|nr:hypothetical protein [Dickeya zeae]ACZ76529.1 hypothetical protein Dd586_1663 [Dickeya parazeae Ech586]UCZ74849.1 hypothetical protein LHK94_17860 [Dickeya zeae]